jgi:hypothetical protein
MLVQCMIYTTTYQNYLLLTSFTKVTRIFEKNQTTVSFLKLSIFAKTLWQLGTRLIIFGFLVKMDIYEYHVCTYRPGHEWFSACSIVLDSAWTMQFADGKRKEIKCCTKTATDVTKWSFIECKLLYDLKLNNYPLNPPDDFVSNTMNIYEEN